MLPYVEIQETGDGYYKTLQMYHEGTYIGDYERSKNNHIERKRREAQGAARLLVDAYERHGKIVVRWTETETGRTKQIRTYQEHAHDPGDGGVVVGEIPREYCIRS